MDSKGRRLVWWAGVLLLGFSFGAQAQFYHGMHQDFGQNRIQYEDFLWSKYEFENYTVYFNDQGKNLAIYTAKHAEAMVKDMEQFFDYPLKRQRIQFVVYQKLEHFRQSNVGIPETDESNIGGRTQIAGTKIFLYFSGDLNDFRKQIRRGVAQVLMAQMLFGDNWREMLKNSTLLHFPDWYMEGLEWYATEPWSVEADDRLRDIVLRDKFLKFARLKGKDAEVAGRALWYYIGETYGSNVIPNIIYMSRVSRNIESGFLFVLGIQFETLLNDADAYFKNRYQQDIQGTQEITDQVDIRTAKRWTYTEPKISPDGRYIAYAGNEMGKTKIWVYDLVKKKRKKFMRQGHRLDRLYDLSYPIMDWNPETGQLFAITEKRGKLLMYQFDPKNGKKTKRQLFKMEKVLEMEFAPDGKSILFSAINKGRTDIYHYKIAANASKALTADLYDDRYPSFLSENEIIFSSNRKNDTVNLINDYINHGPQAYYDLFSLSLEDDAEVAMRMTNTPLANEWRTQATGNKEFTFLSDKSGITNRYRGYLDSSIVSIDTAITYRYFTQTEPITNYPRGINGMDVNLPTDQVLELVYHEGESKFMLHTLSETGAIEPPKSNYRQSLVTDEEAGEKKPSVASEDSISDVKYIRVNVFDEDQLMPKEEAPRAITNDGLIDVDNYTFEDEAVNSIKKKEGSVYSQEKQADSTLFKQALKPFELPEQRNYNIAFAATDLTTQFDFDYSTELYQPFNGGPYIMPGLGTFLKVGMLDVFEDYKVEGGFRYSFNNNNIEYFASLHNRSKRLDKEYIFQRQVLTTVIDNISISKSYLHQGRAIFRYPIDEVNAIRTTFTVRNDRIVTLAANDATLEEPDDFTWWGGLRIEYIFDNTLVKGLNLLNGSRAKVFAEHYRDVINTDGSLTVLGFDGRNYQRIWRGLIWANRAAGSSSFGPEKLVYYMGSVDNWILLSDRPRFDETTNIARDQGYRFQTIATNMRGFIQNARNGNNFMVLNSELRWPVVKFFTDKPIRSEFFANFQVIGFLDVGTAWNGPSPYSDENAFNNIEIDNNAVKVTYRNQSDPIIAGTGWGLRTKIWGYFVRFDYAWGIENGLFLQPTTHLSFGLDF